tara:strand:+ start:193 stop:420 length:228 start_codon:yes stop_codon:yes gene_type:complete
MDTIDYIFIGCIIIAVFCLLVILLQKIIPKEIMMKSSESNIKKGKTIGTIIGIVVGLFISYYLIINNYFGLFGDF